MEILINYFFEIKNILFNLFCDERFLFIVTAAAFVLKAFFLFSIFNRGIYKSKMKLLMTLILLVLISSMVVDFSWLVKLCRSLFFQSLDYSYILFFIRIAWAFYVLLCLALSLLVCRLAQKDDYIGFTQKIFFFISATLFMFFVFIAFYRFGDQIYRDRPYIESVIVEYLSYFLLFLVVPYGALVAYLKTKKNSLPRIVKKQINVLIKFLILPLVITDTISLYPFCFITNRITNSYAANTFGNLLIAYAIFYCIRKIVGLRFLNIEKHVKEPTGFNFVNDFRKTIDQLGQASDKRELELVVKSFFKEAFDIPEMKVSFCIRNSGGESIPGFKQDFKIVGTISPVEESLKRYIICEKFVDLLNELKVVIIDELEFSNYYEKSQVSGNVIDFMTEIFADIFVPIFYKNEIIAFIFVERFARVGVAGQKADKFYSDVERDQIVVLSNYLGNIIRLMQSKNLSEIIAQTKDLKDQLYLKLQENNQYKEGIRKFLKYESKKDVGICFYKNDKLSFGNSFASDLLKINLNSAANPIVRNLKKLSTQVLESGYGRSSFITDQKGEKLAVTAVLNSDGQSVVICIRHPEVSDVLQEKMELVKDPTKLDYLLYLETTRSGKLIESLIPGNSQKILSYKIDLLKVALSKKAIILDLPEPDTMQVVEIIHDISFRENLHVLELKTKSSDYETAVRLFGINDLFGLKRSSEKPLLQQLDRVGTLFIKNINYLEMETQKYLAEFIKYGFFKEFRGDKKTFSDVRIVCSTAVDLNVAVENKEICPELFEQLKDAAVIMPSLMFLTEEEIFGITESFADKHFENEQISDASDKSATSSLDEKDKKNIFHSRPVSFFEIKSKIRSILDKKSNGINSTYEVVQIMPSGFDYDTDVIEAIKLGKHALRDEKMMRMLWEKFGNQNKIANLLGVNRSSINRRFKDYKII